MQLGLKQVLLRFMFWVHDFTMGLYLDNGGIRRKQVIFQIASLIK